MEERHTLERTDTANASVHSYLSHVIDYAGLFPPAQLPLEPAVHNYASYLSCDDSWMLGRFIIPAFRLNELYSYVSLFSKEKPLTISAVGQKSEDEEKYKELLYTDLARVRTFCEDHKGVAGAEVFEAPLPASPPSSDLLQTIAEATKKHGLDTFCEVTISLKQPDWENQMLKTLDEIAAHNLKGGPKLGMKLRMGGVTSDAFPSPEQVAAVLAGTGERGIPVKFTAGLHHPIRMFRNEADTRMHGFLNVFTAGMLVRSHGLDVSTAARILADENPNHFSFTKDGLQWQDYMLSVSDILLMRKTSLRSFGSCSFNEPREDLRALGIL
ncbi:hypothetical protein SAMN05192534_11093 [Alteribacillus persepolensis]|uniref:Uncharacterized protein n=1 Tax=Alteribacillus persepolensis TaxID=568899 RepID=A0A1G8EWL9_9BACI|nr:hypothetical protein [Alteribacillus persepolensis]SDH74109.1 hypothetical protein SAMN05192534_11093 [Alteribacillus persepolensis]